MLRRIVARKSETQYHKKAQISKQPVSKQALVKARARMHKAAWRAKRRSARRYHRIGNHVAQHQAAA